jgi:hypothetical protein
VSASEELWTHTDERGARVVLARTGHGPGGELPEYELAVSSRDPEYLANELLGGLSRADLLGLVTALGEHLGEHREGERDT